MMVNQSQLYAISAHRHVSDVSDEDKKKYGSMCHKLPVLIRQAGLAQAISFIEARGYSPHQQLLNDIAETIPVVNVTNRQTLATCSRESDLKEYMYLTRCILDALIWYKRFTQSILDVDGTEGDE